jgi:signal transduction histidine kinase
MTEERLRRLLDAGRSLIAELDPEAVLDRLLDVAQDLTEARYAAIGVLDERRQELERFLTRGIDEETHRAIGDLPRGRGVLGVLIRDPQPLRLGDVGAHPESYGFPLAHPPMRTFLGVPILIGGKAWGNLYLTEKRAGEFTQEDEEGARVVADWAAIAISNARLYRDVRKRRDELERANRGLETTTEIGLALGGLTDLDRVFELVVKRSRALINARATELSLLDGDDLVIAAMAGDGVGGLEGRRLRVEESVAATALRSGRPQRFREIPPESIARRLIGATTALVTPMIFRNRSVGFLIAFDRLAGDGSFSEEDERLLQAFAASASAAVATAQTAGDEALRRSIQASEYERQKWARELHDETLQELAGLKVLLSGARRSDDAARLDAAVDQAIELLTHGIANLRGLIADLRPAALDELGVEPALQALAARVQEQTGLVIELSLSVPGEQGEADRRYAPELEETIYRLIQEALTNVVKHAHATSVLVQVADSDDGEQIELEVRDDGRGFDPAEDTEGFGLLGMRERVALVKGTLDVRASADGGTVLLARLPMRLRRAEGPVAIASDPRPRAL